MEAGIAALEQQTGKKFGDLKNPLLVSVRSGARDSMPGMMDTILNLGLNDQTVEALAIEIVRAVTAGARRGAAAGPAHRGGAAARCATSEDFQALAVLFKRVKNIAQRAEDAVAALDRDGADRAGGAGAARGARRARGRAIEQAAAARGLSPARSPRSPALRPAVDRFFTEVFVMAEDARVRTARLTLMADLRDLILALADISEIVPQTE